MQYREVPKTGDKLSTLGFGCMRLPSRGGGTTGRIDTERASKQIQHAIDQGVNYLDTAYPYHGGASESFLGELLSRGFRDDVRLATKLPPWMVKQRADMDDILAQQLGKLKTDRVDYYLLHALEANGWRKLSELGVLDFLEAAKKDGRIVNAGFSFHGDRETFKQIIDAYDWAFCQIQYNYLDRLNQAGTEGLEYAASQDLAVMVMEPLRGGNLARRPPAAIQEIWDESPAKRAPADWALRWVMNHPEVTVVLSGMNEEAHIDENLRVASETLPGSMTAGELALVDRVERVFRERMKAGCTGCQYCMPCPAGVDIPMCFDAYNMRYLFEDRMAAMMYTAGLGGGMMGRKPAHASLCVECGACEKKCPQGLPIRSLLKDVASDMEGRFFKQQAWLFGQAFRFQAWMSRRRR